MQDSDHLFIPDTRPVIECKTFTFCVECDAIWLGDTKTCEWCGSHRIEQFKAYMTTPIPFQAELAPAYSPN